MSNRQCGRPGNLHIQPYDEKKEKMTLDGTHVSLHDRLITVVANVLREDPEPATDATMSEDTARRLATRVVHALDQIPQTARHGDSEPPTPDAVPQDAGCIADLDILDMTTCPACPHPLVTHDAIGTRFCRATIARALPRGCTCPAR